MKKIIALCVLATINIQINGMWTVDAHRLSEKERSCVEWRFATLTSCLRDTPEQIEKKLDDVCAQVKAAGGDEALMFKVLIDELELEIYLFTKKIECERSYLTGLSYVAVGAALAYATYQFRHDLTVNAIFIWSIISLGALLSGMEEIDHERRPEFFAEKYTLIRDLLKKRIELCNDGDSTVHAAA